MNVDEYKDEKGRLYRTLSNGNPDMKIVVGPPEGLVDSLELPEPFATNLHNALFRRGLFNMRIVSKNPGNLQGALQEVLHLDTQKLTEAFFKYENQEVSNGQ